MRLSLYLIMVSLISLAACGEAEEKLTTTTHSAFNMRLAMPDTMELGTLRERVIVEETDRGFHIYPDTGRKRRVPIEVWVEIYPGQPEPPGRWPEKKMIGKREIHYRIDRKEGGMGGPEYDFRAWEHYRGSHILYKQYDQLEEPASPRFDLVWKVIEGTGMGS